MVSVWVNLFHDRSLSVAHKVLHQYHEFYPLESRAIKATSSDDEGARDNSLFMCPESCCSSEFSTAEELQDHIHFGEHDMKVSPESMYDRLKCDWAAKFLSITLESKLSFQLKKQQAASNYRKNLVVWVGRYKNQEEEVLGFLKM